MRNIVFTHSIVSDLGARIKARREELHLSRSKFVDTINKSSKRPEARKYVKAVKTKNGKRNTTVDVGTLTETRLIAWENGVNRVDLEWIPAICDVLFCDVGFLFCEYDDPKRQMSDAAEYTGLSSAAVLLLHQMNTNPHGAFGVGTQGYTIETVSVIDDLILSKRLFDVTNNISLYAAADGALPQDVYNSGADDLSTEEYKKFMSWANGRELEVKPRREVKEMYLQAAADALKMVCRDISEEAKKQNIKKRRKAAKQP